MCADLLEKAMDNAIKILYEDNHILVVVKPPNMLTQSDHTGDGDLLSALKNDIKARYGKPGNVYLGLVHRLDRPVGGAMVFAKTSKAASRLSEQIRTGKFEKSYAAVVHGIPEKPSDTLVHYLLKDEASNTVRIVHNKESGKKAVLDYCIKETADRLSLVGIKLHTGRPHQIRVQLAAIGNPLYGDRKYGDSPDRPGVPLALWAVELGFEHPTMKERMTFVSTPPPVYPWNIFSINVQAP